MISQLQQQAIAQQVYVSPEEIQKYIKNIKKNLIGKCRLLNYIHLKI